MTRPSHHRSIDHLGDHELWPALARTSRWPSSMTAAGGCPAAWKSVTRDRQCLWIQLDAGMGRQLIHHQDGFTLEAVSPASR